MSVELVRESGVCALLVPLLMVGGAISCARHSVADSGCLHVSAHQPGYNPIVACWIRNVAADADADAAAAAAAAVIINTSSQGREAFDELYPLSIAALRRTTESPVHPRSQGHDASSPSAPPSSVYVGNEFRRFTVSGATTHINAAAMIVGCDPAKAQYGTDGGTASSVDSGGGAGGSAGGGASGGSVVPDPSNQNWIWDLYNSAGFVTLVAENIGDAGSSTPRDGGGGGGGGGGDCNGILERAYRSTFGGKAPGNYTWPAEHACLRFSQQRAPSGIGADVDGGTSAGAGVGLGVGEGGKSATVIAEATLDYATQFLHGSSPRVPRFAYVGVGSATPPPPPSPPGPSKRHHGASGSPISVTRGASSHAGIDAALAGFLEHIFSVESPLRKRSLVLVVGEHGALPAGRAQSVAEAAHATQGLLWAMVPAAMAAAEPEV